MGNDDGGNGAGARVPRRLVLKSLAAGAAIWEPGCGPLPVEHPAARTHAVSPATPIESPTRTENRRLGSDAYALKRPALANEVEGYASACSAIAGDRVDVSVNVSRAQGVRWDLYRIGHYQGHGARLVTSGPALPVSPQVTPTAHPHTGLLECAWPATFSVTVAPDWLTGYYLFKLTNDDGFEAYVPLVVCESGRKAPLVVQASVTTWQAYNDWGGINLYINHLPQPRPFTGPRGYQVSFDRPYGPGVDIGYVEHFMARWLEQQGYDVGYITNLEVDRDPELLNERQLFMSVGHDEYWSVAARGAVQRVRDQGLPLAFFSGNVVFRRIRYDRSSSGVERRIITCYKSARLDPRHNHWDTTADYRDHPNPQPENELVGVVWKGWARMEGFPFLVTQPDHWLYEGTGLRAGDSLGHIVGYEWDVAALSNGVSPEGLEVVAESPVLHEYGYGSAAHATVYYPTPHSFVFGAGTTGWARGLSEPGVADPRVQRATENVLRRAGLFPESGVAVPPPPALEAASATSARVLAGTGAAGYSDGAAASAAFNTPAGVAAGPEGELYVCETGNDLLRKISADGEVSTVSLVDEAGARVRISTPTGIAVDATGTVYLCDTANGRILSITPQGVAHVYAGAGNAHGLIDAPMRNDARFNMPRGLAIDTVGALYVADFRNDAIRRIDAAGVVTVAFKAGGPTAVAVGPDGTLYYVATWLGAIVRISPSGVRTVLANTQQVYGDRGGPGAQAALRPGDGLIVTPHGLLFSDTANNRVRALAFDDAHTVSTVIGSGRSGARVGPGSQTELCVPRGLTALGSGYAVADSMNHRILHFEAFGAPPTSI